MDTSIFLARLLGLLFLFLGAAVIINKDKIKFLVDTFHKQPALVMIAGVINLILGLLIILSHNVWSGWPVIITILGYLITAKGLARLFVPEKNTELTEKLIKGEGVTIWGGIIVALGAILAFLGFSN